VYSSLSYSTVLNILVGKVIRPPTVSSVVLRVDENSPANTYINIIPSKARKGEALHFNITSGNTNGAFRVQECSGTLFVDVDILDFENPLLSYFNLSVMVVGEMVTNVSAVIIVRGSCPVFGVSGDLRCPCVCVLSPVHSCECLPCC
jgi:hypothetical protein